MLSNIKLIQQILRNYHTLHKVHQFYASIPKIAPQTFYNSWKFYCTKPHIVQMRGLDLDATEDDVIGFFQPLGITPSKVHMRCDIAGRTTSLCEVEFATYAESVVAMRKRRAYLGNRFIRLSLLSQPLSERENIIEAIENAESEKKNQSTKLTIDRTTFVTGHFIRMRNLPTRITEQAIYEFFMPLNVCVMSVKPVYDDNGYRTGEFDIEFMSHDDALKAMSKNNMSIGKRSVEFELHSGPSPVPRPDITDKLNKSTVNV